MGSGPGAAGGVHVLAPLAGRTAWPESADGVVRAMPVILRLERLPPPRSAVLEAAAAAALAVCVDPPQEWVEPLHAWIAGRIRKIARRARGAHWAAVQELPGVTVTVGEAQARALLPGPVEDPPKVVSRLQIGGTDLEPDDPGPPPPGVPVIHVDAALGLTLGKAAAQVGHASMMYAAVAGYTGAFAVRDAGPGEWARLSARPDAVAIRDGGFTEVAPGTVTCVVTPPA